MATSILTYANRQKVAEALTERGYPVTRQTVNRWARGAEMPGVASTMVAELFGHSGPARRPPWADELLTEVRAIKSAVGVTPEMEAVAREAVDAERRRSALPDADGAPIGQ